MNIRPILQKIGLNEKETDIYLACLKYGPETITNIARHSGCKRSTLYYLMEGLLQRGFVIIVRRSRKTLYDAEKPKKLLTTIRAREQELVQLLPELELIQHSRHSIPNVEIYEGEESVSSVYDEIYSAINSKDEVCFLTSIRDLKEYAPHALDHYLAKLHSLKEYKVRELIYDDKYGVEYVQELRRESFLHPCKLLPTEYPLHNDVNIFGNKIALFSFPQRSTVTVIDNHEIMLTVKTLYECAWAQGRLC